VHFRYDDTHPLAGSHHQKIVVIDDRVAFVGGFDLACKRWDTPEHHADDPRRVANGKLYPPFHDVMAAVDGEAARVLATIARKRWQRATGEHLMPVAAKSDPWPEAIAPDFTAVNVGVATTFPAVNGDSGVREVEQLYLDMIARARRYIYIENQYFTAQKIGAALAARLQEPGGPEIVVVSRLLSHGWLEEMTMHVLRTRLVRELHAADRNDRFHIYHPHVDGLATGTCVDMHSKVMVIDDEWLRIGSANLSNRSMGLDTECDVVVAADSEPAAAETIRGFRDRLIAEHLGVPASEFAWELGKMGSMSAAIAALRAEHRTLKRLDDLPEWPEAVMDAVSIADPERPVSLDKMVAQFASDADLHQGVPIWKQVLVIAIVLVGLTLAWRFTPLAELVTADNVTEWAHAFAGQWWAPLVIVLAYTPASVVMFPRPLITLAAVVAFGAWAGFLYAMVGILLASTVTYFVGRTLHRDTVRRMTGEKLNRLSNALRKRGLLAVTALRLVPLAPFAIESLVAGAIRIELWHFLLGTFLGMLPGVLAATVFGDQLESALRDPAEVNYWVVGGLVLALLVGALIVRKWFTKVGTAQPSSV